MRTSNKSFGKGRKEGYGASEGRGTDKPRAGGKRPARRPSESFADKRRSPSDSERPKSYSDKPPRRYGADRPSSFRGDRKPEGESSGDFKRSPAERKPYGDKPRGRYTADRPSSFRGDRKPAGERTDDFKRSPAERKPYGDKPPGRYGADRPSSFRDDRKPTGERSDDFKRSPGKRTEGKPFEKRSSDRPFVKRPGGPYKSAEGAEGKKWDREDRKSAPFNRDRPSTPGRAYRSAKPEGTKPAGEGEGRWNRKENHEFYGEKKKSFSRGSSFSKSRSRGAGAGNSSKIASLAKADDGTTRLNKYISNAGICSRREADELIETGVISVNDEIITQLGYKVKRGDVVKYNNSRLKSEKPVYLLVNKPKDYITTVEDPRDRKTVMSLIRGACKERVYPVGRLDRNTTGLLLFTNDGQLADKLTHPSFEVQKIYEVHLDKNLKPEDLEQIRNGINLEDGFIQPDDVSYSPLAKSIVGIELHSGRNRIVRRVFESLGYDVIKLDRVIYAGLTKKDLPRGRWRFLTELELAQLKMISGSKNFKGGRRDKIYKKGE